MFHLRSADPSRDNAALCDLARRCPQGRRTRFYHQRDDFRERCRQHADAEVFVIERAGRVVATAALARKPMWLGGTWRPAAYFFDLMVDPACRGQGLARQLLDRLRQACPRAQVLYCHVVEDNEPSRRLFESEGFTAHPQLLRYHVLIPRLAQRPPSRRFAWSGTIDLLMAEKLDAYLQAHHDFIEATGRHDGLFRLEARDSEAWAVLRRQGPKVFVGLPWYHRFLGCLVPFLPRLGRPVRTWTLHHLGSRGADRSLSSLLRGIAWHALRASIDAVAVPLFANDPLTAVVSRCTLTRWGLTGGAAVLYVAGNLADLVLHGPRPLLMSARDG